MSDETSEAIFGDAVAASLEKPKRRHRGLFGWKKPVEEKPPYTHCEDCGTELHGHYCSNCGQVAVDYRRSFRHVIADVAESFLNWDSKFTKTLGLLLISPGWLTNQFVAGRRTRYLHPLRLYLLVSIVFFSVRPSCAHPYPAAGLRKFDPEGPGRDRGGDEESPDPRRRARTSVEGLGRKREENGLEESGSGQSRRGPVTLARAGRWGPLEAIGRWSAPELAETTDQRKNRPAR